MPIWGIPKNYGFSLVLKPIVFRKSGVFSNVIVRISAAVRKDPPEGRIADRKIFGKARKYVFLCTGNI